VSEKRLVITEIDEKSGVARLLMNRGEKKNALSRALLSALIEAVTTVRANDKIHCIVLDSASDSFSAGQDLHDLRRDWQHKSIWGDHTGSTMSVALLLRNARQITIASVRGYCLGGGMVLMNACDLAFSEDTAKIGMPEILRGSYGRSATPTLFHSRVPIKTAFYISLTGRNLSGKEAARTGIVSGSVPAKKLTGHVMEIAKEIASRNPVALEHAKIAAYSEMDLPFDLAIKADEAIGHRMRYYTDPLADVDGYLKSQKGGGNLKYKSPRGTGRASVKA
jgi:enoyl-CoA hydratase/carnithine racemase